ncbi:unnamed protein product [Symbiodinium sp. CCMP2456]|nr:unnamed protein product [Symbiodinium sp. CCMP2456]
MDLGLEVLTATTLPFLLMLGGSRLWIRATAGETGSAQLGLSAVQATVHIMNEFFGSMAQGTRLLGVLLLYRFVIIHRATYTVPQGVLYCDSATLVPERHALPDQQSQPGQPGGSGIALFSRSRRGAIYACRSAVFPPTWATITWATKSCFVPRPLSRPGAGAASACLLCDVALTAVQEHFQTVAYEQALRVESACDDCDDVSSTDAENQSCFGRQIYRMPDGHRAGAG